ncbi:hypothetical protein VC83_07155 [Pseudogymnoascus destructans]|uniref:Uncharacterized protein n=2 Tax=Pseudogymnoascus destructans TaxID=655981 RepID=L8FY48_PSED2|nr:uncharacterized protein VC83_07155 [Pseudogymnoascus destructans]ELR05484.1 hypothetical protein GMDG_07406 [Pseudogymnoascus destructans 20631-21]OAF56686.1 hypothetical protein VC83_07155 [Pseudogymnoascus destructans]
MSLKRSNTRFGFLRATLDSDENGSNGTASPPAKQADEEDTKRRSTTEESSDNDPPPNKLMKRSRRRSGESGRGRSRFRAPEAIQPEDSSPWERLQMRFNLSLNEPVIIATQKDSLLVAVRKFSGPDAEKKLDMLS